MKISHLQRPLHTVSHTAEASLEPFSPWFFSVQPTASATDSHNQAYQPFLRCPPPQPPGYDHDVRQWKCSH
ncbi:hypothetical protein PHYPO_G00177540 [Pangasianodon hypophthalmus]|uniref:Uncharacterized protein n=1 Tax=Pangasianodon hypophthalmus TaxID=310915 RepID=A0A5N5PPQ8_PANHP|nr:hypothetical protein PHYPO_G00177540 [Pangasianodon hypophthalmus]